jgi:hypothetical protein
MQLIIAPMIADLLHRYGERSSPFRTGRSRVGAVVAAATLAVVLKMAGPMYDWWGLREGGFLDASYPLPFDELRGFRVSRQTADLFGELFRYRTILRAEDAVFAYPDIPIVYLLLDKRPPVRLPTLWFDVSDASQLQDVVSDLERAKPEVIFWLKPPNFVYSGHAELRRLPSLMGGVDEWIYEKISSKEYHVEYVLPLNVDNSWRSSNPDFRLSAHGEWLVARSGVTCDQIRLLKGLTSTDCHGNESLAQGAVLGVTFINRYWLDTNVQSVGIPYSTNDSHTFIVLRRKQIPDEITSVR